VLQAAEVVVALVFVDISVHVSNGGVLIGGAGILILLAVTADGPLGILRLCGRRLHVSLMVAVGALLALAPVLPALRPDIEGIIVIEFGAVGLIRLATLTRTASGPSANSDDRTGHVPGVIDATATERVPAPESPHSPTPGPQAGAAARWLGRATGSAAAGGRRMVADHRPEVEAQVKRTIRGAGRAAGRITAAPVDPDKPADG
jgi:hypothetical protein